jgi:hypothetical protein
VIWVLGAETGFATRAQGFGVLTKDKAVCDGAIA